MASRLHILQHSLGLDKYGRNRDGEPVSHRNHFVTSKGTPDFPECMALVADGLMTSTTGNALTGGGDLFQVTLAGRAYVAQHSEKPPKLTRSQKRYREFLRSDCGLTFAEWLGAAS